ncbi:LysR family transcriptional regulator [Pandoraea terrae]|uniref:LysR family transcriptional regulator n=1 Tax=Pandoraea terrae TaxID=1537710 RepID=A0A5E4ZD10_9BURK|nr:LysR substrate-binding domain-containing protein [Pandoraea terrae]VVE58180.1 LysR family transcriptional regulator [Pandoraea terrae]
MKIRQLEAFRALIVRQTVTRAAQMLHVSQPAVTRLINDLEADVGFALFERANGRLHPTPEGMVLFEEVERSFAGLDRIAQTAEQIKSLRRGSLHIAGAPAMALEFLPGVLTAFIREHEGINTTLLIHASSIVIDLVVGRRCDVGFIAHPLTHAGANIETIHSAPMRCILPLGHRLAEKPVITPEDLRGESFISFPKEFDARMHIDGLFAEQRIDRVMTAESQLSAAICVLVEHGAGVALIDQITAHYASQRVVVKPFEPTILSEFAVVTSNQHPPSQLAKAFVDYAKRRIGEIFPVDG